MVKLQSPRVVVIATIETTESNLDHIKPFTPLAVALLVPSSTGPGTIPLDVLLSFGHPTMVFM